MLTLDELIWETWAVHEAFRRLSFPAEKLFLQPAQNGLFVVLRDGEKHCTVRVCDEPLKDRYEFASAWHTFVTKTLQTAPDSLLDEKWEQSTARRMAPTFVLAVQRAGFSIKRFR